MEKPSLVSTQDIKSQEEIQKIINAWIAALKDIKGIEVYPPTENSFNVGIPTKTAHVLSGKAPCSISFSYEGQKATMLYRHLYINQGVGFFFYGSNENNSMSWQKTYEKIVAWMRKLTNILKEFERQ